MGRDFRHRADDTKFLPYFLLKTFVSALQTGAADSHLHMVNGHEKYNYRQDN